jgi:excisionase family DNA binding protein
MAWTVNDACRQLSISRSTIYSLVRARKLKLIKISGRALVPDSEVCRLVDEGSAP